MSDAQHSNPIEIEITEPSSLNEQAAVALVIVGALVAVADRQCFAGRTRRGRPFHQGSQAGAAYLGRPALSQCSTSLPNGSRSRISPMW